MTTLKRINFKIKELIDIWNFLKRRNNQIFFITEKADWVIKYVVFNILIHLKRSKYRNITESFSDAFLRNKIIHYGSINTFLNNEEISLSYKSNKIVLTWFHVVENNKRLDLIPKIADYVDILHTACNITAEKLINHGFPSDKIVIIPLGVDQSAFFPANNQGRLEIRKRLGISNEFVCIGSFQKDGVGWGKGLEPKLIKGPDVFCDAAEKLNKKYNILVLLSGPARGYVKERLSRSKIPFIHKYCKDMKEIGNLYKALDLYIVSSRVEGGPLSLFESMASGIPVISTKVGMTPEVICDRENGMLCDVGDTESLVKKASELIDDKLLSNAIIENAIETASRFSWEKIAAQYYERIYRKLLD